MSDRRQFLNALVGCGVGIGSAAWLSASESRLSKHGVEFSPDIQRLVDLIDSTSRDDCPAMLVRQLKSGVPFRDLLAATFLYAALRDGHHTVYIVNAAFQLTQDASPEDRFLPLVWAVDNVKEALARAGAAVAPPISGRLPKPAQAASEFDAAMKAMDREKAEHAVIALGRAEGPKQAYARFMKYAARDNFFIGHIPIAIMNSGHSLNALGWHHAEPTLRYIVRDMYRSDHSLDGQPYKHNVERADKTHGGLPIDWAGRKVDKARTLELYSLMGKGKWWNTNDWIAERLASGDIQAATVWDAVHLFCFNMMVSHRLGGYRIGNRSLHSNTVATALHDAFNVAGDSYTRYLTMLQAVSWVTEMRLEEQRRGFLRENDITAIERVELKESDEAVVEEIFESLPPRLVFTENEDRTGQDRAAELAFSLAKRAPDHELFLAASRKILCHKLTIDAHELKFPVAMFQELHRVSPTWHPHLLAATVHFMQSSNSVTAPAIESAIKAMKMG